MFSCQGTCAPRDRAADTVRVSIPPAVDQHFDCLRAGEGAGEEACPPEEDTEAPQPEQEPQAQETERLRLEEEEEEQAQREREEAEERQRREHEEAMEQSRRAQEEEAARAEAARRADAERLEREQERKALVSAFLKEHGYNGVAAPKRTMLKTKYPIHTAAKLGDPKVVAALLEEGANPKQKNSAGKTAAQVAFEKNKQGSHADVLRALGRA